MRFRALQIENTDEAVLYEKRHDEFGTRFHAGLTANITRIFGDVIDPQDATFSCGSAREAMMKREAKAERIGWLLIRDLRWGLLLSCRCRVLGTSVVLRT